MNSPSVSFGSFSYLNWYSPNFICASLELSSSFVQSSAQVGTGVLPLSSSLILLLIGSLSQKQMSSRTSLQTRRTISKRTPSMNLRSSSYLSNSSRANKDKRARLTLSLQRTETQLVTHKTLANSTRPAQPQVLLKSSFLSSCNSGYTVSAANLNLAQLFALPHRLARPTPKPPSAAVGRARSVGLKPKCGFRFSWRGARLRANEESSMEGKDTWVAGFTPARQRAGISPAQNCQGHSLQSQPKRYLHE